MERLLEVLEKSLHFTHTCLYEPCVIHVHVINLNTELVGEKSIGDVAWRSVKDSLSLCGISL